ncbi:MAG TPA: sensor domain-containing diguanylate cyclase [bacterium]|nr:sensor domain-containing diguanylate cyclase [bacterium]
MRTEKISVRNLLDRILATDGGDTELRKSLLRALAEPDPLIAWEQTLEIMDSMSRAGRIKWLGVSERNGERFLRFQDPRTMDIFSLREPPTVKAEVVPFMPRGFVRKEDADKIEMLFTSIATCRSEDELGGVLRRMLATVRDMLSADYCVIHFTDESLRPIIDRIADGSPEADRRFAPAMTDKWVRDEGFCVSVPDLRREPELSKYAADGSFSSVVVMPLRCKGKTYGVLETWSRFASNFAPEDIGFLSLLAMLVAGMVRNAEHLETLIFRDPLTHVYNRGYLEDQLSREIERYKRTNEPVSFLLVDVDNFKQVNTNFGHPVGDLILSSIAQLLEDKVRQIDVVARYGGDEFGIILPDTIGEHAVMTAERLRGVIEANDFSATCPAIGDMRVTISVGGAICPYDAVTKEDLIEKADKALAQAERAGKNQVVFYSLPSGSIGA